MTIRAICTDIDGTLLDSRRELSNRTISIIRRIRNRVPVILASSRMPSAMTHLQRTLDITGHPLICYNGGYVLYDQQGQYAVLDSVMIPADACTAIVAKAKARELHVSLYQDDNWYAPGMDAWAEREARITKVQPSLADAGALLQQWTAAGTGAHKIMCMGTAHAIDTLQHELQTQFGEVVHAYRSKDTYLEIAPSTISKASALTRVLAECYNLTPADAIAFGDNYNDIAMLQAVGNGVAVANARAEVLAVAGEVTLKNTEDGVAVALEKYFA